jgi:hypothetical protein
MVGESRYNDDRKKAIGIGETASMLSEMEVMTFELSVKRERGEESTAARSLGCNPGERDDGDQQAQTIALYRPIRVTNCSRLPSLEIHPAHGCSFHYIVSRDTLRVQHNRQAQSARNFYPRVAGVS